MRTLDAARICVRWTTPTTSNSITAMKVEIKVLKKQTHGTNCCFCKGHLKTLLMKLSLAGNSLKATSWLRAAIKPPSPLDRALTTMLHAHISPTILTYRSLHWQLRLLLDVTAGYVCRSVPWKRKYCFSIFKAIRTTRVHPKQEQHLHPWSPRTALLLLYNTQCKLESHRQSQFTRSKVFSRVADGNGFKSEVLLQFTLHL